MQVAHACRQAGFDTAIPVCWGDELVAAETLQQLRGRGARPAIFCACPLVTERLLARGPHLAPFMVATVAPPVASARYVRRLFEGSEVRITYVGSCPGAHDEAIDERAEPRAFLDALAARGIDPHGQPLVFDSVIPPDRRRHFSVAGGMPAAECLTSLDPPRVGVEITVEDFSLELAQHLIAGECTLLDVAPRLGCACSGWRDGAAPAGARSSLSTLEPPRSTQRSVVDLSLGVDVSAPLPLAPTAPSRPKPQQQPPRPQTPQLQTPQPQTPQPAARGSAPAPVNPSTHQEPRQPERPAPLPDARRKAAGDAPRQQVPLAAAAEGTAAAADAPGSPTQRRKAAGGAFFRTAPTTVPRTRSGEGPALPRAYVARRGTPTGSGRAIGSRAEETRSSLGSAGAAGRGAAPAAAAPPPPPTTPSATAAPAEEVRVLVAPAPAAPPPATAVAGEPGSSAISTPTSERKRITPRSVGTYTAPSAGAIAPPPPPQPSPAPHAAPVWRTPLGAIIGALVLLTLLAVVLAIVV